METPFKLKPISRVAVPRAIERAERYRLLNEPHQAESICLDILAVEPEDQRAMVVLILAITDQFATGTGTEGLAFARSYANKLTDPYDQLYYQGIICERQASAFLTRGMARSFAYDWFEEALEFYERAESIRPTGNDDALLRWNACVRIMRRENLTPHRDHSEPPLE